MAETNCVCKIDLKKKKNFNGHLGSITQSPLYYILSFYFKRALLGVNYLTLYKYIIAQKKKYPKGKKNDERKKRYNTQRSKHELDQRTYASTGRNLTFPHFLNATETWSFMFPLHLRFAETCNTNSWRFYQVSVMFPERKCQLMFPSYLSQNVSAVVRFRYVSGNGFLIS